MLLYPIFHHHSNKVMSGVDEMDEMLVVPFEWNFIWQTLWVGLFILLGVYKKEMWTFMKFSLATISSERWFNFV